MTTRRPRKTDLPTSNRTALYTRISRDREGLALGVDRQREDLDEHAAQHGLDIVARFQDNDLGASPRSRKRRPDYQSMIAEAATPARRFDNILSYTASRLTRRPREAEDLIELAERHGVRFLYRNSPSFDLNTADGRNIARILGANDAAESERIGERVSRASASRAEKGAWHGGWPPAGYRFSYDLGDPPKVTGLVVDEPRAAILLEMAPRIIAGETLYALCRDLNRREPFISTPPGAKAPDGTMWRSRTLKRALCNPALIGKREYGGELFDGTWPAIFDTPALRKVWDDCAAILTDPARNDPDKSWMADTSRKRALSGLMVCGAIRWEGAKIGEVCGATLVSQPWGKPGHVKIPTMICSTASTGGCGHLRITYAPVEEWVVRLLIARLDGAEMRAALAAQKDTSTVGDEAALRRSIQSDEKALRDLEDERDDGLSKPAYLRRRDRVAERIEASRHTLAALVGARSTTDVTNGADLSERLAGATVEQQRALLNLFIDRVVVLPHPRGAATHLTKRRFEAPPDHAAREADHRESLLEQRVQIVWKELQ